MQATRKYKCVFDRNLYDTDETNSIFEIRVTLQCPIFEEKAKGKFAVIKKYRDLFQITCRQYFHTLDVILHTQ
jgi:hypothetical protein